MRGVGMRLVRDLANKIVHHLSVVNRAHRHAHRVHETARFIDADVRLHIEIPLMSLLRRRHFGIALLLAINVASTIVPPRSKSSFAEKCFTTLSKTAFDGSCHLNKWQKLRSLDQVQDRLDRNGVVTKFHADKWTHRPNVIEYFFGTRVWEIVPSLWAVDAQHGIQLIRSPAALRCHFLMAHRACPTAH